MSISFPNFFHLDPTQNYTLDATDFLVGYRVDSSGAPVKEIRISAKDLSTDIDSIFDDSAISSSKVGFTPLGTNIEISSIETKLNDFKTLKDYKTINDAAVASFGQRLFISRGNNVEIFVPSQFGTIGEAMQGIAGWYIEQGASVTINVTQSIEVAATTDLNHPCGVNIRIIGNTGLEGQDLATKKSNAVVITTATADFDVFSLTAGHVIGLINGFVFNGLNDETSWVTYKKNCFKVTTGSSLNLGEVNVISYFYKGIDASYGANITANNITIQGCGYAGLSASYGSVVEADGIICQSNGLPTSGTGYGVVAEYGSVVNIEDAVSNNNLRAGIASLTNSLIKADNASASVNGTVSVDGAGFLATNGGRIECLLSGTQASNNTGYGFESSTGGVINAYTSNSSGNGVSILNPIAIASGTPGEAASVYSSEGSILLKTNNSRTQVEIADIGVVTTSNVKISGGVPGSTNPVVQAAGAGADINIDLRSKGAGDLNLQAGVSGFVNLGERIKAGNFTTSTIAPAALSAAVVIGGYITIKDSAGVDRKLLVGV